jgi:hypothetical protein
MLAVGSQLYLWARFEEVSADAANAITRVTVCAADDVPKREGAEAVPLFDGLVLCCQRGRTASGATSNARDAISEAHILIVGDGDAAPAEEGGDDGVYFVKVTDRAFLRLRDATRVGSAAPRNVSVEHWQAIDKSVLDSVARDPASTDTVARFLELVASTAADPKLISRVSSLLAAQRERLVADLKDADELSVAALRCLTLTLDPAVAWQQERTASTAVADADAGRSSNVVFAVVPSSGGTRAGERTRTQQSALCVESINHFGSCGGFEALLQRIDDRKGGPTGKGRCTLRELRAALGALRVARYVFAPAFAKEFFVRLQESVFARLTCVSAEELRELTDADNAMLDSSLAVRSCDTIWRWEQAEGRGECSPSRGDANLFPPPSQQIYSHLPYQPIDPHPRLWHARTCAQYCRSCFLVSSLCAKCSRNLCSQCPSGFSRVLC